MSATKVGWFSSDKFDCENQQVIEAFKNKMACEALVQCDQFGFRSLSEVSSASASNIDRKVEDHRIQNEAKMRAQMPNPSAAELAWVAKQTNKIAEDEKAIMSNLPNTFVNFRSVNDDFNPSISKYQCRAQFTYNKKLVRALLDSVLRTELTKNKLVMAVTFEELRKNPRIDHLQFQLDAAMQARGIAAQIEENAPQTTVFTVQPSKQRGFDIEIVKLGFPGG
ncbi:MAG: hypothetical protein EKK42_35090 [Pseudonocardiaceae bacterium]|nr:MAG: hypothetical protein EKK42_35090 [Pseudonocardiaceae bacterium]